METSLIVSVYNKKLKSTRVCVLCHCPWGEERVLSAFFLRNQLMILEGAPEWLLLLLRPGFPGETSGSTRPSDMALFSSTGSVKC